MSVKEIAAEVAKASPPVTVGTLTVAGYPMQEWLIVITIVYTLLQVFFLLRDKWWSQRDQSKE